MTFIIRASIQSADDLAVLKITTTKQLTAISLGDSAKLQVGQDVLAIGNPLDITDTVTSGIISALNRTVSEGQGGATISNAIRTDAYGRRRFTRYQRLVYSKVCNCGNDLTTDNLDWRDLVDLWDHPQDGLNPH